jgi:hypothetical protein
MICGHACLPRPRSINSAAPGPVGRDTNRGKDEGDHSGPEPYEIQGMGSDLFRFSIKALKL